MCLRRSVERRKTERMSNTSFRVMVMLFNMIDLLHPHVGRRVSRFGIDKGMTVVDYGCGPGRYSVKIAEIVGEEGRVYAADIHELAIEGVRKRARKHNLDNIRPVLIDGYNSTLPDHMADLVCAIDMFWIIKEPARFLAEIKRITREEGILVIDDGHQPRRETRRKILDSGLWDIVEETSDHLKCRPQMTSQGVQGNG
jgi:ubiquinone/menaquinone biosynthesis C-methylase UbiE